MQKTGFKSYDELPLFLNSKIRAPGKTQRSGFAGERRSSGMSEPCRFRQGEGCGACDDEAKVLSVSPSSGYELMPQLDFPVLRVGSCMVVPKEQFIQWVMENTEGGVHK